MNTTVWISCGYESLSRAGSLVASPLSAFVVLGSNGETALMDEEERDRVVGAVRGIAVRTCVHRTARGAREIPGSDGVSLQGDTGRILPAAESALTLPRAPSVNDAANRFLQTQ